MAFPPVSVGGHRKKKWLKQVHRTYACYQVQFVPSSHVSTRLIVSLSSSSQPRLSSWKGCVQNLPGACSQPNGFKDTVKRIACPTAQSPAFWLPAEEVTGSSCPDPQTVPAPTKPDFFGNQTHVIQMTNKSRDHRADHRVSGRGCGGRRGSQLQWKAK